MKIDVWATLSNVFAKLGKFIWKNLPLLVWVVIFYVILQFIYDFDMSKPPKTFFNDVVLPFTQVVVIAIFCFDCWLCNFENTSIITKIFKFFADIIKKQIVYKEVKQLSDVKIEHVILTKDTQNLTCVVLPIKQEQYQPYGWIEENKGEKINEMY